MKAKQKNPFQFKTKVNLNGEAHSHNHSTQWIATGESWIWLSSIDSNVVYTILSRPSPKP